MRCAAHWALCLSLVANEAAADEPDYAWSADLYLGPATSKFFGAVVTSGDYHANSVMAGIALDRRLLEMGHQISIGGEGQITQWFVGHEYTAFSVGVGLIID